MNSITEDSEWKPMLTDFCHDIEKLIEPLSYFIIL
jgi:hypothetical protein